MKEDDIAAFSGHCRQRWLTAVAHCCMLASSLAADLAPAGHPGSFTLVTRPSSWQRLRAMIGTRADVAPIDDPPAQAERLNRKPLPDVPTQETTQPPAPPTHEASQPPATPIDPMQFARGDFTPGHLASELATATNLLYERLSEADIAEIEELIKSTPGASEHYEKAPAGAARRQVLLAFGAWLQAPCLTEKTGLRGIQPPDDVHAMARDPLSAAGGLYDADLILDALRSVGVAVGDIHRALDFGCSSGRVVRVLAAVQPSVNWHACDPNGPAIAWATENLPGIEFFVNGDSPPLPFPDGALDLAYAISIWSHFEPELGLRWFEEMHRIIQPGGLLVCTTHGLTSIAHYVLGEMRTPEQSAEIRAALYRDGCWYAPEFGDEGDWGVMSPAWGTAFLSPEWMLSKLCPRWRILEFAPARNQENQDVYVLQRV